ncbi:MAG: PQQ-binding-like beta-propeller repeat protein [Planctomycetota bacterium]
MDHIESHEANPAPPPRLWPAWVILAVQAVALILTVTPSINNAARFGCMVLGPVLCGVLFVGWLVLGSRLSWRERWIILFAPMLLSLMAGALVHSTVRFAMLAYGLPFSIAIVVLGLFSGRRDALPRQRLVRILAALALLWGIFPLGRIDGVAGNYLPEVAWRWAATHEASLSDLDGATNSSLSAWRANTIEWPGFRGPAGNSRAASTTSTPLDWSADSPQELWRIPVGPAWSSFAYVSGRLFTQEQRAEYELVTCYDAQSGSLIWRHRDKSRFTEVVSGAGPRATPTYDGGFIYTYGANAILNCLDAETGARVWRRNLMAESSAVVPVWGFTSSPLVMAGVVIVYGGGNGNLGLVAFDAATGSQVWQVSCTGMNFSSAQGMTIDGQRLVLFGDASGLIAVEPAAGNVLWKYRPSAWAGPAICQPQQVDRNGVIVPLGDGVGVARLEVHRQADEWTISETWSSRKLKPSFNDFVFHDGHLYGFDQSIFTSIDAATGERNWKKGRFGFGQVIALTDRSQLVVTGEDGTVRLLSATPQGLDVIGETRPLSGKTWNHPVVADGRLFVRNGEHAVCLSLGG